MIRTEKSNLNILSLTIIFENESPYKKQHILRFWKW